MRTVESESELGEGNIPKLYSMHRETCVIHQRVSCSMADAVMAPC